MKVVIDSREQAPFTFEHEKYGAVAVERKSLPDLVACLGKERERFERELHRAAALDAFAVVVEASWAELAAGGSTAVS